MASSSSSTDSVVQQVVDGDIDSKDTNLRYLGYFSRIRNAVLPHIRYLGYTSDVGESFRPIVSPAMVKAAYGISWLYLGGDVAYEGYRAHKTYQELQTKAVEKPKHSESTFVSLAVTKRAVFQATATMLFPALTIHSIVKYSAVLFKNARNVKLKLWGPTVLGLGIVPALPYIFDAPIEHVVDSAFEHVEKLFESDDERPGKEL